MACWGVSCSRGPRHPGADRAVREARQAREHMALRATLTGPCPPVPTELRAGAPHADGGDTRVE